MWIVGVITVIGGVWSCACGASHFVFALFANVAVLLAFIATYWFLDVLVDYDARVGDEDTPD